MENWNRNVFHLSKTTKNKANTVYSATFAVELIQQQHKKQIIYGNFKINDSKKKTKHKIINDFKCTFFFKKKNLNGWIFFNKQSTVFHRKCRIKTKKRQIHQLQFQRNEINGSFIIRIVAIILNIDCILNEKSVKYELIYKRRVKCIEWSVWIGTTICNIHTHNWLNRVNENGNYKPKLYVINWVELILILYKMSSFAFVLAIAWFGKGGGGHWIVQFSFVFYRKICSCSSVIGWASIKLFNGSFPLNK